MKFYIALLLTIVFNTPVYSAHNRTEIEILDVQQLSQEIRANKPILLDMNPPSIYEKNHIPGSINSKISDLIKKQPADKKARIVFYCMNSMCMASHQAAQLAIDNGYLNVARLKAGIQGWLEANLPTDGSSKQGH